jgi:hypothetical protein
LLRVDLSLSERPRATVEKELHPDFQRQQLPDLH